MLSAIRDIGRLVIKKTMKIERPIEGKILVINVNSYNYAGIHIEDFDSGKIEQYLYKEGESKGNNPAPFCPLTEPKKTLKKISNWLKQCREVKIDDFSLNVSEILNILINEENQIITELLQSIQNIPKNINMFFTIKINGKFLGEYEVFRKCFLQLKEKKLKKSANIGVCSICGETGKEVSGKIDVFKFYTIDKPGFIAGGFKEIDAWKNYPVCMNCKSDLERGRKFLESNLNFKFYGLNYLLIPQLLVGGEYLFEEIIEILSETKKTIALRERIKKKITDDEKEILEYLSKKTDVVVFNFLFLQKQQSAERILLLIEDVLPSRIRKIFDAKDYVDTVFQNNQDRGFTFGTIRTFFSKSSEDKRQNDLDKYFLEIINSVFKGKKINFSFLVKLLMTGIRRELTKDPQESKFNFRVKDALMSILFFERLNIISFEEEGAMSESIFDNIFTKYGKSLSTSAKRGIFLLGVLTQLLLNKQWSERNAKPFIKKLKGLKMDEKDIKALLPEVQNKLEEYEAFDKGKQILAQEISKYFLEAGDNWNMSVDEINFYFACGMNLADEVVKIIYK
ncbi:MAG TPA: TIGR02556 family CRISPR-associated protein [Thermoanaerobacter sp.]|jgi:CRISPR-associated protein Csh1|nr:TIGR02556 family CRISPR-associated protein [Thermoanaerobacter sp.]